MRNSKVQLLVGLLISGFFLYLTLKPVKYEDLMQAVRGFRWMWAVPFVAVTFLSMYVRALRWHFLMRPTANLTTMRLFSPMMAGFAINSLLPARAGEFARAYVLSAREKLAFTSVFATVVVERIFDTLTLIVLLPLVFAPLRSFKGAYSYSTRGQLEAAQFVFWVTLFSVGIILVALVLALLVRPGLRRGLIALLEGQNGRLPGSVWGLRVAQFFDRLRYQFWLDLLWILMVVGAITALWWVRTRQFGPGPVLRYGGDYQINADTLRKFSVNMTIFCFLLLAGTLLILWKQGRLLVQTVIERTPMGPKGLRKKVSGLVETFAEGLLSLRDVRLVVIVSVLSLAVWLLVGWSMQIMAYGFGDMASRMSVLKGTALTVITCLAILIPAAPGYWGLMELGIVFGMQVLGIENNYARAIGYALLAHSLQVFPIIAVGLYCLWREKVSFAEITQKRPTP